MTQIRLDQVNLVARDVAAAVDFYRTLGVQVAETAPPWDRHHRNVATGGDLDMDIDSSTFAAQWDAGWHAGDAGVVIGFRVDSREAVDEVYERVTAAGYAGHQAPYDAFWGSRYAVVADPDGNAVGIMSPRDSAFVSAPPDPDR